MIALPHIIENQELKEQYLKLSSFIRSLYEHTELNKDSGMDEMVGNLGILADRLDAIITTMDSFEQNDLGMK